MRIVYDHRIFGSQTYGGVSRYVSQIAGRIAEFEDCDVSIVAPVHVNRYLRSARPGIVLGRYFPPLPKTASVREAINNRLTTRYLRKIVPDIVHETYYARERLAPARCKIVLTVYDMIHERLPDLFSPKDRTRDIKAEALKRADRIICISHTARADVLALLPIDPGRVSVVHLGYGLEPDHEGVTEPVVDGQYLLFVGRRRDYKNFDGLLRALGESAALGRGLRLICFGGGPFSREELTAMRHLGIKHGSIIQLAGDDSLLIRLYKHAAALVFPSLYEGFGLPTLEAMSFGCPVVCSNVSSIREVVGEAAELCDPTDTGRMAVAIERVLSSVERASALRALGFARVKRFSWERCAAGTYAVYRSLM